MEYKERLITEYRVLVTNVAKISQFLNDNNSNNIAKEKLELMNRQLDIMCEYENILERRILLEMGC